MGLLATLAAHDLGLHPHAASWWSGPRPRSTPWSGSSASKATCSTGTTRRPSRPLAPALRLHGGQREPGRRAGHAGRRDCAGWARRSRRAAAVRGAGRRRGPAPAGPARPCRGPGAAPRQRGAPGRGGGRRRGASCAGREAAEEKLARLRAPPARAGVGAPVPGAQREHAGGGGGRLLGAEADRRDRGGRGRRPLRADAARARGAGPPRRTRSRTACASASCSTPQRRVFSIGYRLADAEGPGRLDPSFYDLLASEARLASFLAIAKRRRAAGALVPPGPAGHQRRRLAHPALLERHRVRVPDAAAAAAELPGDAARPDLPDGGAPADRIRGGARRALGRLGVGVQRVDRHGNYQYKAFGVPGPRPQARPGRRAGGRALRHRAGGDGGAGGGGAEPAAARARGALLGAYGFYEAIDYTWPKPDCTSQPAARGAGRAARSCGPISPTTRA